MDWAKETLQKPMWKEEIKNREAKEQVAKKMAERVQEGDITNYMALENWVNVYDGDLGIALSDTYTSGIFLSNLSRKQAKLFDGVRCDSGNEFEFIDRLVARYKELGIDATTKTIVFSNALDFTKALDIQEYCKNKIRCSFGIGTNLTNDTGFEPSNIVMKLTQCKMNVNQEWRECVKLSDDAGNMRIALYHCS